MLLGGGCYLLITVILSVTTGLKGVTKYSLHRIYIRCGTNLPTRKKSELISFRELLIELIACTYVQCTQIPTVSRVTRTS